MCHENNSKCSPRGSMFWNEFLQYTVLYIKTIHIVPQDWSTHLSSSRVHVQGKSCVHTVVRLYVLCEKCASGVCLALYGQSEHNATLSLNWRLLGYTTSGPARSV